MVEAAKSGGDLPIAALGSGSDYTPFLQHLGIAALNIGYGGEDKEAGIYHSTYDSYDHFIRFGDPKFEYCATLARTAGRLTLRSADADVLPLRFGDLAETVGRYEVEVEKLLDAEREDGRSLDRLVASGAFRLAADPTDTYLPPPSPGEIPRLDFSPLRAAVAGLKRSAAAYDSAFSRAAESDFGLPMSTLAGVNSILQGAEQALTSKGGLPGRDWYKHMIYAPGLYTGYGAKTLPYVREAVELHHWADAEAGIPVLASVLNAASARIDQADALLHPGPRLSSPASGTTPPPDN
jgi:N-acetylated-alpha-linked acidic dipeptidase